MGVDLRELIPEAKPIDLSSLRGKAIAIDAYNALYQFLSIIRQPDGTPLMDSRGRITSHLSGLFYRTINLLEEGLKPIYVFDGKPPEQKEAEIVSRLKRKEEYEEKYEEALAKGDLKAAKMYAQATSRLTEEMVNQAKKLLDAMGVPWVQAPSEGEAQAAFIALRGEAWAAVSQDYDSLLFGAPRLIRNLTISGKRKLPRKDVYVEIEPELIELDKLLSELQITREQLIDIAIMLGTDYNPDGVKGIGPKKALKIIKMYGSLKRALDMGVKELEELRHLPIPIDEIKRIFLEPNVSKDYKIVWRPLDPNKVIDVLCREHDFSEERVKNAIERVVKATREISAQRSLDAWFK
ncbi:MAG: flap endonuclease-1 [Candidatus Methanomethylicota archaeon]|uniref:Flap endonuclease 1 n=1 Tax=Thermoproteota archaeon TaxID=2056631 RepID=A0A497EMC2_9CREN|nr:MAG: flap endonuclease-1 [Candidatus Verstraetearchaeota archaeon]